jgi:hypothetical protein
MLMRSRSVTKLPILLSRIDKKAATHTTYPLDISEGCTLFPYSRYTAMQAATPGFQLFSLSFCSFSMTGS